MQASDVGLLNRYMQLLTPEEQSYVREGSSEAVQRERLLARTLQRTTLARYLAISQLQLVEHAAVLCSCVSQHLLVRGFCLRSSCRYATKLLPCLTW